MTLGEEQRVRQHQRTWDRVWVLAPYGLLGLGCGASLLNATGWEHQLVTLAIAAGLGVWHWWFAVAHPDWCERRTGLMVLYFAGLLALTALLVSRSTGFQIFVPACYVLAFVTLPGWFAYAGAVLAGAPWLVIPETDVPLTLLNLATVTPLAALIGWAIRAMEGEAARRHEVNTQLVAALAENARLHEVLVERAKAAATAEERARLAREIHDTAAQGLAGIVTQLEAAEELSPSEPVRDRLGKARYLARTSLTEVRRSIEALRPGPLENTRLAEAISGTAATWQEQHGVATEFTLTGTPRPAPAEAEVAVLRAAQEALSNIARHAHAERVDLTLSYMDDLVVLDVRDDGTGFDVEAASGFGLLALRERVGQLAGSVEVESAPGAGTALSVAIPLGGAR
ncbi:sensor histidine kinase [Saccharopolyspora sp. NPDC000359]|uniref:sensor histidine kinase n=1 Tax=Saccharopolyspora sp. NPDC000359 TaxID=3154251 RepID=UPI003319950A